MTSRLAVFRQQIQLEGGLLSGLAAGSRFGEMCIWKEGVCHSKCSKIFAFCSNSKAAATKVLSRAVDRLLPLQFARRPANILLRKVF